MTPTRLCPRRNCPFHIAIYKQGYYSYRDLPLRWCELGTVYRYERSGTMHGALQSSQGVRLHSIRMDAS